MKEKLVIRLKEKFKDKNYPEKTIDGFASVLESSGLITEENLEKSIENVGSSLDAYHNSTKAPEPNPEKTEEQKRKEQEEKDRLEKEAKEKAEREKTESPEMKEMREQLARLQAERDTEKFAAQLREKAKAGSIDDDILANVLEGRTLSKPEDIDSIYAIAEASQKVVNSKIETTYKENNFVPGRSSGDSKGFQSDMQKLEALATAKND